MQLPTSYYAHDDVVAIARDLIGKKLITETDGVITSGYIVETEAYRGPEDKASHAYNSRRTTRTEVMYSIGGTAYVYLCYGIHHMMNVVTGPEDVPHAVLIRALQPIDGVDIMQHRRNMTKPEPRLTRGPGALAKAMGIHTSLTGISMTIPRAVIRIEDAGHPFSAQEITSGKRIGIDYAQEAKEFPWRFYVRNHPHVSRPRI